MRKEHRANTYFFQGWNQGLTVCHCPVKWTVKIYTLALPSHLPYRPPALTTFCTCASGWVVSLCNWKQLLGSLKFRKDQILCLGRVNTSVVRSLTSALYFSIFHELLQLRATMLQNAKQLQNIAIFRWQSCLKKAKGWQVAHHEGTWYSCWFTTGKVKIQYRGLEGFDANMVHACRSSTRETKGGERGRSGIS